MNRHPAFWLGLAALAAGLLLLLPGRQASRPLPPIESSALPVPKPEAKAPATATQPAVTESLAPAPSDPADNDYPRWHRADLGELCAQFPVAPPVYELLAQDRYPEALQAALPLAERGELPALGLIEAYRNLCDAFVQSPPLGDFMLRQQNLLEGESPEVAARITRYLEQERSSQETLNQGCPQVLALTDSLAARYTEILVQKAGSTMPLSPTEQHQLGLLLMSREPGLAAQQMEKAAAAGNAEATYWLSQRQMETAWRKASSPTVTAHSLHAAARLGSVDATFELGQCSLEGCPGILANPKQAIAQLRAASTQGHALALSELVDVLHTGRGGVMPDPVEALGWALYAENLNESGHFNSAYFEVRRQFRELRAPLESLLGPEERRRAQELATRFQAQYKPHGPKPEACRALTLPR